MFDLTYWSKYEGEIETIKVKKEQKPFGPGSFTDIEGKRWNAYGIFRTSEFGHGAWAVPESQIHSYFIDTSLDSSYCSGTSNSCVAHQKWIPYRIEIVN
jgi:hypothetical protein